MDTQRIVGPCGVLVHAEPRLPLDLVAPIDLL